VVHDHIAPLTLLPALWCRELGERLRLRREELGLRADDRRGQDLPFSGVSVRRWEKAHTVPKPSVLAHYLAWLRLSASDLLVYGDWPPALLPQGGLPAFAAWLKGTRAQLALSEGALAAKLRVTQPTLNLAATGSGQGTRTTCGWSGTREPGKSSPSIRPGRALQHRPSAHWRVAPSPAPASTCRQLGASMSPQGWCTPLCWAPCWR